MHKQSYKSHLIFLASFSHICEASNRCFCTNLALRPGWNVETSLEDSITSATLKLADFGIATHIRLLGQLMLDASWMFASEGCFIYTYLEPVCPLFWELNPPKEGRNSNQNKGHLGSRYIYIFVYFMFVSDLFFNNIIYRCVVHIVFWGADMS